jgi:hypothetical protein
MTDGPKVPETKPTRPYRAPTLRRLGSVREVTWGPGSGFEGAATGKNVKKKM